MSPAIRPLPTPPPPPGKFAFPTPDVSDNGLPGLSPVVQSINRLVLMREGLLPEENHVLNHAMVGFCHNGAQVKQHRRQRCAYSTVSAFNRRRHAAGRWVAISGILKCAYPIVSARESRAIVPSRPADIVYAGVAVAIPRGSGRPRARHFTSGCPRDLCAYSPPRNAIAFSTFFRRPGRLARSTALD
ncbi:unnamed protein product, partial [Iphiclides podalirius]